MKTAPRAVLATFLLFSLTMCKKDCPEPPEQCNFVNVTDGLVAYYPFNGNANDISGNGNNANALNGIQLTTNRAGKPNTAYLFDGVDDYLELPGNATLNPQRISIALWFNMEGTGKMQLVGNNDNTDGYPFLYGTTLNYFGPGAHLGIRPPGSCNETNELSTQSVKAAFTFTPGKWYCYAVTFDGLKAKIYVDGEQIAEQNITFQTLAQCTGTTFKIGRWWNGDALPFKGKIDEVRVYNRSLSKDEVKMLCATCNEQ
jgi:hypothetical protein